MAVCARIPLVCIEVDSCSETLKMLTAKCSPKNVVNLVIFVARSSDLSRLSRVDAVFHILAVTYHTRLHNFSTLLISPLFSLSDE